MKIKNYGFPKKTFFTLLGTLMLVFILGIGPMAFATDYPVNWVIDAYDSGLKLNGSDITTGSFEINNMTPGDNVILTITINSYCTFDFDLNMMVKCLEDSSTDTAGIITSDIILSKKFDVETYLDGSSISNFVNNKSLAIGVGLPTSMGDYDLTDIQPNDVHVVVIKIKLDGPSTGSEYMNKHAKWQWIFKMEPTTEPPDKGELTIKKELLSDGLDDEIFTFNILKDGVHFDTVTLPIDGKYDVTIKNLDDGIYAVEEVTDAKYTAAYPDGNNVTINERSRKGTVTVTNTKNEIDETDEPILTIYKKGSGNRFVNSTFYFLIEKLEDNEWVQYGDELFSLTTVLREGILIIDVPAGTYKVTEVNADGSPMTYYTVSYSANDRIVEITEEEGASITVTNYRNSSGGNDPDPREQEPKDPKDSIIDVEDPPVPEAEPPDNEIDILEPDVPQAKLPKTGVESTLIYWLTGLMAAVALSTTTVFVIRKQKKA
jgi:hypothetical protein